MANKERKRKPNLTEEEKYTILRAIEARPDISIIQHAENLGIAAATLHNLVRAKKQKEENPDHGKFFDLKEWARLNRC